MTNPLRYLNNPYSTVTLGQGNYQGAITIGPNGSTEPNAGGTGVSGYSLTSSGSPPTTYNYLSLINYGRINGGNGGAAGVDLTVTSVLVNKAGGTITGGQGYNTGTPGGIGVNLAAAPPLTAGNNLPTFSENYGSIAGGVGGAGAAGGAGVSLSNAGVFKNYNTIAGGQGGTQNDGLGGAGGMGATVASGAILYNKVQSNIANSGTISGGAGGSGATGGAGGAGVYMNGGTLITSGTISGGAAGPGTTTSGAGGDAIQFGTQSSILDMNPGAVFNGQVAGNGLGNDTLQLSGTGTSALTGFGTQFTGFGTLQFDAGAAWTVDTTAAAISTSGLTGNGIVGITTSDLIDVTDLAYMPGETYSLSSNGVLTLSDGGTTLMSTTVSGSFAGDRLAISSDGGTGTDFALVAACYRRGTRIRAAHGEVPIECLKIGDEIVTLSGATRAIRWIGRRCHLGHTAAGNRDVLPILIRAGALAAGVPTRDLWVSPEHALYVDDLLIPARALTNGTTIVQETAVHEVTYYHLEFESHAVIYAEGAPAESFVDDESREMFDNAAEFHRLYPHAARTPARFCAPRVEGGWELDAVRRRLAEQARCVATPPSHPGGDDDECRLDAPHEDRRTERGWPQGEGAGRHGIETGVPR